MSDDFDLDASNAFHAVCEEQLAKLSRTDISRLKSTGSNSPPEPIKFLVIALGITLGVRPRYGSDDYWTPSLALLNSSNFFRRLKMHTRDAPSIPTESIEYLEVLLYDPALKHSAVKKCSKTADILLMWVHASASRQLGREIVPLEEILGGDDEETSVSNSSGQQDEPERSKPRRRRRRDRPSRSRSQTKLRRAKSRSLTRSKSKRIAKRRQKRKKRSETARRSGSLDSFYNELKNRKRERAERRVLEAEAAEAEAVISATDALNTSLQENEQQAPEDRFAKKVPDIVPDEEYLNPTFFPPGRMSRLSSEVDPDDSTTESELMHDEAFQRFRLARARERIEEIRRSEQNKEKVKVGGDVMSILANRTLFRPRPESS